MKILINKNKIKIINNKKKVKSNNIHTRIHTIFSMSRLMGCESAREWWALAMVKKRERLCTCGGGKSWVGDGGCGN